MTTITHRPSGQMCAACAKNRQQCCALMFSEMPAMRRDSDGAVVVKCTQFQRAPTEIQ